MPGVKACVRSADGNRASARRSGGVTTSHGAEPPDQTVRLQAEIAGLADLDLHGLRVRWRKLMRKEAPEHLGRALLIRIIVYRMQARVYGDLDAASIKLLHGIARDFERQRKAGLVKPKAVPVVTPAYIRKAHGVGTMFIREHEGQMHRVIVVADGFEWQGTVYRSLTEIAQCITGTIWSGPRFFGLRERKPGSERSPALISPPASGSRRGRAS